MIMGRPKPFLTLAPDEQTQLHILAASRTLPHALVARAKAVLWSAEGQATPRSPLACTGEMPLWASGDSALSSTVWWDSMTNCVRGGRVARLLDGDIAEAFFQAVLQQARERSLLSDQHFTVDGTLLEAWASVKIALNHRGRSPIYYSLPSLTYGESFSSVALGALCGLKYKRNEQ